MTQKLSEVFVANKSLSAFISRQVKKGKIRKLASRLYTTNLTEAPESIIKRNLWSLVADYFPKALISDRTALEYKPAHDGTIFIVSSKKRTIKLPGLTIIPRKGVGPLDRDKPFISGLYLSSQSRAFIENLRPSRARTTAARRTLTRVEIEEKLDALLRHSGESALKRLRDEARTVAHKLKLKKEAKTLNTLIGALLGTKSEKLFSPITKMRATGRPYDPQRVELFQLLFETVNSTAPIIRPYLAPQSTASINLSFFEAYFSNFIEGTEFSIDEAEAIIFGGKIPKTRPQDAHDVLGTYSLVSDSKEMQKVPTSFTELLTILKMRHATIMSSRKDKIPGYFKKENNKAGSTIFVAPELVEGTLYKGFEFYQSLETAFAKAVFMMFLVLEAHPFMDGNGRVARVMMNAELISKKEQRVIIPTVYRNNYLSALKALSLNKITEPLIRTLDFAQKYTGAIDWQDFDACRRMLESTNAFCDPQEADMTGARLKLP